MPLASLRKRNSGLAMSSATGRLILGAVAARFSASCRILFSVFAPVRPGVAPPAVEEVLRAEAAERFPVYGFASGPTNSMRGAAFLSRVHDAMVIDIGNILFGSEMVGAVRGIDPRTGHYFDDTKRYIDALSLPSTEKERIFENNARRVFPRLDALLRARGL